MANTEYAVLKKHFDKLIYGAGYPGGLEPIRDTYERAFNIKINLYDVYQTNSKFYRNPLNGIITLIGPKSNNVIPSGIIPCNNDVFSVNVFDEDIFKDSDSIDAESYIYDVYKSMKNVVEMDTFYSCDSKARENPYLAFIKCCPLYFTFHHIKDTKPELLKKDVFIDLIEKYIVVASDSNAIYESMLSTKYSTDIDIIYNTITAKNTVELFW